MNEEQERWAVFWCSLLRPILYGEIPKGGVAAFLRKLASEEVVYPNGQRKCPPTSTLKRKLKRYRRSGFEALFRKPRSDKGIPRVVPAEVIDTAVAAKREQPYRSDQALNQILDARHGKQMKRSTLYSHLKKAGATRTKLGVVKKKIRKRWSCEKSHDMWVGDFSQGPCVLVNGTSCRSHLSAFVDVHSRYIVSARYYLREDLDVLCDTMVRGMSRHGLPLAIYLDNGKVYHSHALKTLCWRHNVRLLHRPPKEPEPGGLIERFFQTVQTQFEREVRAGEILDLQKLNRAFYAWLDVMYHQQSHSETNESPKERFEKGMQVLRQVDLATLMECFLKREVRTVNRTFSDISLHKRHYRVDGKLRGDRVEVRYDGMAEPGTIQVYSLDGEYLGTGVWHDRTKAEQPERPVGPTSMEHNLLAMLEAKQRALHKKEAVDFSLATRPRPWPFESFAACLADLVCRKGGVSAWSKDELASLQAAYNRHPGLTRRLLKRACAQAAHKTVPAILYALQNMMNEES